MVSEPNERVHLLLISIFLYNDIYKKFFLRPRKLTSPVTMTELYSSIYFCLQKPHTPVIWAPVWIKRSSLFHRPVSPSSVIYWGTVWAYLLPRWGVWFYCRPQTGAQRWCWPWHLCPVIQPWSQICDCLNNSDDSTSPGLPGCAPPHCGHPQLSLNSQVAQRPLGSSWLFRSEYSHPAVHVWKALEERQRCRDEREQQNHNLHKRNCLLRGNIFFLILKVMSAHCKNSGRTETCKEGRSSPCQEYPANVLMYCREISGCLVRRYLFPNSIGFQIILGAKLWHLQRRLARRSVLLKHHSFPFFHRSV